MKRTYSKQLVLIFFLFSPTVILAWVGMAMPKLHVDGRYFKDEQGNIVNLHGFAQTYSPWFNEQGSKWTNYNVNGCLSYNKGLIDKISDAGWKMSFVRMHMDPYWSNTPGVSANGESDISAFSFDRFKTYLNSVFIPMAQYAISKGLYVVMRPPGVCPRDICVGDAYQKYLMKVWGYVAQQPALEDNPYVMFELANEPVNINNSDGSSAGFKELKQYFQAVVDTMRKSCDNILLVPGLSWQANYAGFADYPIDGDNIAYAVHCYPGWYNSGNGIDVKETYLNFKKGWDAQIGPVSDFAPVIVTEMDWAPAKYNASWGKSTTGTAGGAGFGANFKKIADDTGNVSWLIFTTPELLAKYTGVPPAAGDTCTFLNDPEACPWPTYRWYQEYSNINDAYLTATAVVAGKTSYAYSKNSRVSLSVTATYSDGHTADVSAMCTYVSSDENVVNIKNGHPVAIDNGDAILTATYVDAKGNKFIVNGIHIAVTFFPLSSDCFNPSICETGSFDEATGTLITGKYGFGGWKYANGIDLSAYKYVVAELSSVQSCGASFRLFDENSYWTTPVQVDFGSNTKVTVDLQNSIKNNGASVPPTAFNPAHVYIVGIWSVGASAIRIKRVYVSNDGINPVTGIAPLYDSDDDSLVDVYNVSGVSIRRQVARSKAVIGLPKGVYIVGKKCIAVR